MDNNYSYEQKMYVVVDSPKMSDDSGNTWGGVQIMELDEGNQLGTAHPVYPYETLEEAVVKAEELDPEFVLDQDEFEDFPEPEFEDVEE